MTSSDKKKIISKKALPKKMPPKKAAASGRRSGSKPSANRTLILDTVEKLMLDEGYAAVSTRRVATEAGLKPPLVHYYFSTTDDLFIAAYRRATEKELEKLDSALASPQSLQALWITYNNEGKTALAMEFMALANHRKAIQQEIAQFTERTRRSRAETLSKFIDMNTIKPDGFSAEGLTVLMLGIARTLVMENGLGISLGHAEANAFVEWWLEHLQKTPP